MIFAAPELEPPSKSRFAKDWVGAEYLASVDATLPQLLGGMRLGLKEVQMIIAGLYSLPHYGKDLESALRIIDMAHDALLEE